MRTIKSPRQTELFDPLGHLPESHRRDFLESPEGVFRAAILAVLPAGELAEHFSEHTGRPTKEMYAMAGLTQMMEMNDWTVEQAVQEYMWNGRVQLALNVSGQYPELSARTFYRYLKLFRDNDCYLAQRAMDEVTRAVIEIADIDVSKQRLDSTHVFSNMATFGRTRMMGVAIKRFLTQVIRHDPPAYEALDESMRKRYEPSQGKLFADTAKSKDGERYTKLRGQVAEDMHQLILTFENHERFKDATTFKSLVRIFHEQCELDGDKIQVRKKTGGRVIQNPSDEDATYDGHKGPGYQVHFSETCGDENEVQVITAALPQTAADSDMASVEPVLDALEKNERLPDEMSADGGYGSDENVQASERRGVELVSPTKANADLSAREEEISASLALDDFVIDEATEEVERCPAGHEPLSSVHDEETGRTTTVMPKEACDACAFSGECPIRKSAGQYRLVHTAKARRLAARQREEMTDAFRSRYGKRAGIESTNSGVKQVTGLGRLRVRGRPRVFMAILLKASGWNIRRAAASSRVRELVRQKLDLRRILGKNRRFSPRIAICAAIAPVIRLFCSKSEINFGPRANLLAA